MATLSTREPLLVRGAIVAAITAAIHVAVVLGLLHLDATAEAAIGGAIDLVGTAVLVVWTRGAVSPVDAPADEPDAPALSLPEDETSGKHVAE